MSQFITSNEFLSTCLADLTATRLDPTDLRLFTNVNVPQPDSALPDFQEAFFPGYMVQILTSTWQAPVKISEGVYALVADDGNFNPTGNGTLPVTGWLVRSGGVPLFWGVFDSPIFVISGVPITFPVVLLLGFSSG